MMNGVNRTLLMICISLCLFCPGNSFATYVLEHDFGDNGVVVTSIEDYNDYGYDIIVRNEKIVVVGASESEDGMDFAVVRYTMDGEPDSTFNSNGTGTYNRIKGDHVAYSGVVLEDGSIVLGGYVESTEEVGDETKVYRDIALLKLTESGYEDIAFGVQGLVTLEIDGLLSEVRDLALDSEGRILVGGILYSEDQEWMIAARYKSDGSLDEQFGENGYIKLGGDEKSVADYIALQSDGKIILGGAGEITKNEKTIKAATLYRLTSEGQLDNEYGAEGKAVIESQDFDNGFKDGVILSDNSVVLTGYTSGKERKIIATAKFDSSGKLDSGYGSDGITTEDPGFESIGYSIVSQADNTFLVAGESKNSERNKDVVLIHLDTDGSLKSATVLVAAKAAKEGDDSLAVSIKTLEVVDGMDSSEYELMAVKDEGEPVYTDINGKDDSGRGIAVASDGKVLIAGFTNYGNYDDVALLSYISDTSSEDPSSSGYGIDGEPAYHLVTLSVSDVSRNGALTGGVITENEEWDSGCSSSDTSDACLRPTVAERGVVYGIAQYPSYKDDDDTSTSSSSSTSTSSTENSDAFPAWVTDSSYNYELVRWGKTSDGSGFGTYGSDITEITPDVFYYVRAYAKLSDDTVLYGNQLTFRTEDVCFIATAAYGSIMAPHVSVLREFRNKYLKTNGIGRKFIQVYYHYSPDIADFISQSSLLRFLVRLALLPLVGFSYFMVGLSLQMKILMVLSVGTIFFMTKRVLARR